jgi:excisionase family DNA binding protein
MSDTPQPNYSTPPALEPLQVDVIEAARLLHYSRAKIYEMLSRGELPSTRHGASRSWRCAPGSKRTPNTGCSALSG